jgi:hypothetical protein
MSLPTIVVWGMELDATEANRVKMRNSDFNSLPEGHLSVESFGDAES